MLNFPVEDKIRLGKKIDWDCDQIRALIKKFVSAGPISALSGELIPSDKTFEWTLDDFRTALGNIEARAEQVFGEEGSCRRSKNACLCTGVGLLQNERALGTFCGVVVAR